MVTKAHILAEIKRVAEENSGAPLGKDRFFAETGIKENDWLGKHWARWSDAIKEAGFTPNTLTTGYGEDFLLEKLASLAKELGHVPGRTEIQLKARGDGGFPAPTTFQRLGHKHELVAKLTRYCEGRAGYEDVVGYCAALSGKLPEREAAEAGPPEEFGYVYLLRSGRFYKIGRSNAVGRRERERDPVTGESRPRPFDQDGRSPRHRGLLAPTLSGPTEERGVVRVEAGGPRGLQEAPVHVTMAHQS